MEYPSIEPKNHGWCTDGDNALACPIQLVVATKWNLIHSNMVDWYGCGTWCQSISSSMRHEKQDVAWSD